MPRGKHRELEAQPLPPDDVGADISQNGAGESEIYPPDLGTIFGVEEDRGMGRGMNPGRMFMEIHANDPNRVWAETLFYDERDLMRFIRIMADEMDTIGIIDMQTLMTLKMAGRIAVKGYAREQALKAEVGSRAIMARLMGGLRGGMGRMTGFGRDRGSPMY